MSTEKQTEVTEPAPLTEADELAALDKGIEAATADEPLAPAAAEPVAAAEDEPAAQTDPAAAAEPTDPAAPKLDEPKQPDADTEAEISALGLRERSAARFRELSAEVKELAPIREALKAAGVEKPDELPLLVDKAKRADEFVGMVMETGATAEQYGMTLDYLRTVNQAARGDVSATEQWGKFLEGEIAAYTKATGRTVGAGPDPLADHPDLQAAVESGEVTRTYAMELVKTRAQKNVAEQVQRQTVEQQQAQQAEQQGIQQLVAFDQQMQADPTYAAKRPMLNALVANIRATLPASRWLAATQEAYRSIPDVPAASPVAAPKPPPGPVRPTGPRPTMTPEFKSDAEALDFALGVR